MSEIDTETGFRQWERKGGIWGRVFIRGAKVGAVQPERAVKDAVEELSRMSQLALDQIRLAMEAVYDGDHDKIKKVYDNEETVIQLGKRLTEYLAAANRLSMSEHRRLVISNLFFTVNDIKHAARHGKNIAEHAEIMIRDHVTLTSAGMEDLRQWRERRQMPSAVRPWPAKAEAWMMCAVSFR